MVIVADTTNSAEFDIRGLQISDGALDSAVRNLKETLFSPRDRVVGDARVRELDGFDYVFFIARDQINIVVTVAGVRVPDPSNPTEEILKKVGLTAMFRGATGL